MRFAVIGDVHSNIFALDSVLKDIENKQVDFIISTGDLVGYMPFPNEVIEKIRASRILVIQGNHDKVIAQAAEVSDELIRNMSDVEVQKSASAAFTNWVITKENRAYLRNLPRQLRISSGRLKVLLVHGSPRMIGEYLYEDIEKLTELSKEVEEDIIICGHTHKPYHQIIDNKHFINAGSVGKPKHGSSQATYVIVTIEGDTVKSDIIEVNYEIESIIEAIKANPMIADELIPMLKRGL
ncbi:metallophosphoesterase family protein [Cellulosilyticum sp. I15G10I2]|uniref:metallophosphoesterase family protein n=1 Tax=Cellulosilyticum sp. I15G10I2 TaxID=1892843 RepID=UPI00085C6D6F|nr:metallophosphoesterase family protein [Cellulosilyticum sp. I15G10I2]